MQPHADTPQSYDLVLIDTSAWVEFLRDTGSVACEQVTRMLDGEIAICDMIQMEVLAGARNENHLNSLRRLLSRTIILPTVSRHYETAALLYRTCRQRGETVRKIVDCLIAAVAIDSKLPVLHCDEDFNVLARHTSLKVIN